MAYERIEPWGATRDDIRTLYLGEMILAPWKKRGQRVKPKDFFKHLFGVATGQRSVKGLMEACRAWAMQAKAAMGGKGKGG